MATPVLLLIEKEFLSQELLSLTFTAHLSCQLHEVASYQEALDFLKTKGGVDLIVVGDTKKSNVDTIAFVKALEDLGLGASIFMVRDFVANYPGELAGKLHGGEGSSDLLDLCLDMLTEKGFTVRTPENFVPISLDVLERLGEVPSSIYLKVSDQKFVKYLNAQPLSVEDLDRIRKKNISEVYILKTSFDVFVKNYRNQLVNQVLFEDREVSLEEKVELSLQSQELLAVAIKAFGINEKTAAIANRNIALVKDIVHKSDHLMSLLGWGVKKDDRSIGLLHSTLLCYVCTAFAQHLRFSIPYALEKLALASFFHDMELSDHHIRNERQFVQGLASKVTFNKDDSQIVANHPLKAASAIEKWVEAPPEVIYIVRHHHERADGTGFPSKMKGDEMPDYLVCFLVAHEIVDLYLNYKDVNQVQKEFLELRKTYSAPLFQMVSAVAAELLSK